MKMRELEERTGVDREVIRIMIRKGLLPQPHRPARNMAEYGEAHVRGIAAIRQLQVNSRLTFDEIKVALNGEGLHHSAPGAAYAHLEELLSHLLGMASPSVVKLANLSERFPNAASDAGVFQAMDMLEIIDSDDGLAVSVSDGRLIEIWGKIREAGFVEETGFPPENVEFYLKAARYIARCEAGVFLQNSRGTIVEERAAEMLHVALPLMLEFVGLLRTKAFIEELRAHGDAALQAN